MTPAATTVNSLQERSLAERLQPRIAIEERFKKKRRRRRHKNFLFRNERKLIRPVLKLALILTGLYKRGLRNALSPVIRNVELRFPNLPAGFDGYRILHLSDLHLGGFPGLAEAITARLRELRADLCVMTGDYRYEDDGPCEVVYPPMRRILDSISAEDGVFGILGNHDESPIAFALEDMGMRMLVNDAVELTRGRDSVWLAGVDDPFDFACDDLPGSLASVPSEGFKILLAHSPQLFKEAAAVGVNLYLCGHTHGGQIRFPIVGSLRDNCPCPKEFTYGQWSYRNVRGYTSPGTGSSGLPVRFNCPPEIVIVTLRRD